MNKLLISLVTLFFMVPIFAKTTPCKLQINGYKVVKDSVFPFSVDKEKACFFAFYTINPEPSIDVTGDGNSKDTLWYGYYTLSSPNKIYEFPKPRDSFWSSVCNINAISFYPMHGGKKRDVTVIGSCGQNTGNYTFPFVFVWKGDKFVLDEDVYTNLYGFIGLTVADVRAYIKSPNTCYKFLKNRFNWHDDSKTTCD